MLISCQTFILNSAAHPVVLSTFMLVYLFTTVQAQPRSIMMIVAHPIFSSATLATSPTPFPPLTYFPRHHQSHQSHLTHSREGASLQAGPAVTEAPAIASTFLPWYDSLAPHLLIFIFPDPPPLLSSAECATWVHVGA